MSAANDTPDVVALLRELGRGPNTARPLPRAQARTLFAAMLAGEIDELLLGALLLAYRIKGEQAGELAGMLEAAQATLPAFTQDPAAPFAVSIPSYNGARRLPNLVPLLAILLAMRGIPVLVHGETTGEHGRVTSAAVFAALGIAACDSPAQAQQALLHGRDASLRFPRLPLAFLPIATLSPPLARLLALRERLGLRNSAHNIAKLLDPFAAPSLRLVNFTHPPYRDALVELLSRHAPPAAPGVLLARGCEGEAAADPRRDVAIEWLADGACRSVAEPRHGSDSEAVPLPAIDADASARWTEAVLAGDARIPASLQRQLALVARHCSRPVPSPTSEDASP